MPAHLKKLVRRLDEEYQALSNGYAEESLHQFRILLLMPFHARVPEGGPLPGLVELF